MRSERQDGGPAAGWDWEVFITPVHSGHSQKGRCRLTEEEAQITPRCCSEIRRYCGRKTATMQGKFTVGKMQRS